MVHLQVLGEEGVKRVRAATLRILSEVGIILTHPATREMLAYGLAGFHFDMMDQGFVPPYGCWCAVCRHEFEAQCGREIPRHATWDEDWERFLEMRYAASEHFEKELVRMHHLTK
jgi:hypothetical protein